jgi:hypothetical protein
MLVRKRHFAGERPMHAIAARTAIRPVLMKLHPNLVQTVEGRAKIERMVWDIMKSIDQEGLRFVSAKEN